MDLKGSIIDTNLKIYPSEKLIDFLKSLPNKGVPSNILKVVSKDQVNELTNIEDNESNKTKVIHFSNDDLENLKNVRKLHNVEQSENVDNINDEIDEFDHKSVSSQEDTNKDDLTANENEENKENLEMKNIPYLTTTDIDWLYSYIQKKRKNGNTTILYLHELLEGSKIDVPENRILKRNPVLEERCVKLRAQQESREYRQMTKSVDNVRMTFPEDTIAYQLKQLNRQLIAVGQFIISIFAGFLFGFKGVEWMIGNLDFGFRLLLGVMCALVIALAEIYFLAKKLNEEFNIPETVQLGGPPKYITPPETYGRGLKHVMEKEHQD